jgi:hypothetical protein
MSAATNRRTLRRIAVLAAYLGALASALLATPLRAAADCGGGDQNPRVGGPYNYPASMSEYATYQWQDSEAGSRGGGSASASWTFNQRYYVEGTWWTRRWCNWQGYDFPSFTVTASYVDVEQGQGHPSGIPFAIDNVKNGTQIWEYYHQRNSNTTYERYSSADDGYWQAPVTDPQNDTYASGRWNQGEANTWDPQDQGFVFTTSNDASGGRFGTWNGFYVDYGN